MKPYYYSLSEYLKETYGCKMYKLSLSGGMTCPNRDGRLTHVAVFFAAQAVPVIFRRGTVGNSASLLAGGIATPQHTKIPGIAAQIEAEKALISRNITAVSISLIFVIHQYVCTGRLFKTDFYRKQSGTMTSGFFLLQPGRTALHQQLLHCFLN